MAWSLKELAKISNGILVGSKDSVIFGLCSSEKPIKDFLAFSLTKKTSKELERNNCYIISKDKPYKGIQHPDPKTIFAKIMKEIEPKFKKSDLLISEKSHISDSAKIGRNTRIGPFVFIGENVEIQENVEIHAFSFVGNNSKISRESCLMPHSIIMDNCNIGKKTLIGPGSIIGNAGFNIHKNKNGMFRMPHIGGAKIGNNVTIGALNTIDAGLIDSTEVDDNVKTDSQVHIAHNVELGKNSLIAAKSGIAGSSKIGKNFKAGGRVGVSDHTKIGENVTVGVGSMVISDVKDNETVLGYPARAKKITLAIWASLKKIPEWMKRKK